MLPTGNIVVCFLVIYFYLIETELYQLINAEKSFLNMVI